jgi:hypothetical protein
MSYWLTPLLLVAGSVALLVGLAADQPVLVVVGLLALLAKVVAAIAAVPALLAGEWAYWSRRVRSRRLSAPSPGP